MNAAGPAPRTDERRDRAPESAECLHCGLPVRAGSRFADDQFCCAGCRTVYQLIHEQGLDRYYDLKQCVIAPPADLRRDTFNWLAPLIETAPKLGGENMRRISLDVQGVHCAACVWLIEQLFRRHAAGRQIRINPALGTVDVIWEFAEGDLADFFAEVEHFGYRFGPPRKTEEQGSRGLMIRMGICIAAAMNVMIFSLAYYLGLAPDDGVVYELFGKLNFLLAGVAVVVGGWPFMRSAAQGLRRRILHLDFPIALGMVLAFAGSTWTWVSKGPELAYFDTIAIFVALMLVGRWLQERVLERNRNALLASAGVADLYARRLRNGLFEVVSASEIETADVLWIAPGDLVPVEGVLLRSAASVSLDWITGEADPVRCEPGDRIMAGAFNASDQGFRVAAAEAFSASRLNELITETSTEEDYGRGLWHQIAKYYVIGVLSVAAIGFASWIGTGVREAVEVSVAILVVTCPCALGLGLPLGRELMHARLRSSGVLLRRDSFLDRALAVRKVIFDKTGTLTRGQLALDPDSRKALLRLDDEARTVLANMTVRSSHPVSRTLSAALSISPDGGAALKVLDDADAVREITGEGLIYERDDATWWLGRAEGSVRRTVFLRDGHPLAEFGFEEDLRDDVQGEIEALRADGYDIHLLSGDGGERVRKVAEAVGIRPDDAAASLDPGQKAARVRELDDRDTLMIGDGLNDSPSFDAALCSATPAVDRAVLPQKADFYFLGDGISAVRRSLQGARMLRGVQRDNLIFAVIYNLGAVGLCLTGHVDPLVAAILMPLSSVAVVTHTAMRLRGKEAA